MLRAFGLYLTKSTKNALCVALLCGVLSLFSIPVAWVGLIIVALMTLHDNPKSGLLVLSALALPTFMIGVMYDFSFFMETVVCRGLVVWLLAWVLSRTNSWAAVLRVGAIVGITGISIFYLTIDDVPAWWESLFNLLLGNNSFFTSLWESPEAMRLAFKDVSVYATAWTALWFLILDLVVLLMARGWQAFLYNPGGLRKELLAIHMFKADSIVLLLCLVAFGLGLPMAGNFLPLFMLPFVIAGFSFVQAKIASKESKTLLRVVFYILLLVLLPYSFWILVLAGVIDSWYDFRARGAAPPPAKLK